MKSLLHLDDDARRKHAVQYDSTVTLPSRSMPGVHFSVVRLSFARRMELARRVLGLSQRAEFCEAGQSIEDTVEANILGCEIDQLYLSWGLVEITGLSIDGVGATPALMAEKGPEDLAREMVDAIKAQCGLSENERKN